MLVWLEMIGIVADCSVVEPAYNTDQGIDYTILTNEYEDGITGCCHAHKA